MRKFLFFVFLCSLVGCQPSSHFYDQHIMATLWYQTAAERDALYHQGYNIGQFRLTEALQKGTNKKAAVILDLDETVLDNSPYFAQTIQTGRGSAQLFDEWVNKAQATLLPGALDFLQYADQAGIHIFYVSNRKESQLDVTLQNMRLRHLPQASANHLLLQSTDELGKGKRREYIAKNYDVLLLFGDNLTDFPNFDHKNANARKEEVAREASQFGDKLIIFPNPLYGDWENALYGYKRINNTTKDNIRRQSLYLDFP